MSGLPLVKYIGKIREITIGKPGTEITIGGESGYNFYSFEGATPNIPKLALQIMDVAPDEWAEEALAPFKDVLGDPVAWAKKCVDEYKAEAVCLWLAGTDPNTKDLSAEHAAETAKKVAEAINVPLIVWGVSSDEKNVETLKAVCEACDGLNLVVGPITENNYKQIGAAAIAYKHVVAANSPIDINLAKQLNILLENLGVPNSKILIDPTTGAVGYGMEYCYSIMERIRQAALTQNDEKLQYPIISNIAEEVWKTKEAKLSTDEEPTIGDASIRGVNLEAVTAVSVLQAGSDLLILRHPKTMEHIKKYLSGLMLETTVDNLDIDFSLAPEAKTDAPAKPAASEAKKPAAAKPKAPAPKEAPKPEPAKEPKQEAKPVEAAPAPPPAASPKTETPASSVEGTDYVDVDLTDEELAALRDLIQAFKSFKSLMDGLAEFGKRASK